MASKRYAAGELLKKLGLKRMEGPLTRTQCIARARQLEVRADSGKLPADLAAKVRKQGAWYRWRAKKFPGERRGRTAA